MVRPRKKNQIVNMKQAIKDAAWQQIAENGAASLSLRAIARKLGITAPAIYNHFYRRDDLVTALIVDAYNGLEQSQRNALEGNPVSDLASRFLSLGTAYRDWALAYPQRYQLIFGTPIPNYRAPEEITRPEAVASLAPLLEVLQAMADQDHLRLDRISPLREELEAMLVEWQLVVQAFQPEVLYAALVTWSRVHGLVSMEIGGHIPPFITDPGEVFQREIMTHLIQYYQ